MLSGAWTTDCRSPIFEQEELVVLQQLQLNVVDEIMYHFLVVKEDIDVEELARLSKLVYEEPARVSELRASVAGEGDG